MVEKLKNSRVTPRIISVLLCQVPTLAMILFNVYWGQVATYTVQQSESDKIIVSLNESTMEPKNINYGNN